uniref:ESPR-type extended signal peptide-containing protein n=1 Tax=Dyella japonica TaxID=231455 RepID=UPI00035CF8DE
MNRIYQLVWSESRRAWVPASELSTQRHRVARQVGFLPSARAFLMTGLALCALAYHQASHAQSADDAKLNDLMGLASKYDHPSSSSGAPIAASIGAQPVFNRVAVTLPGGEAASSSVPVMPRKSTVAGVRARAGVPIVPTSQQMGSGVALPADLGSRVGAISGGANVAALGQGVVSAVLPSTNDAVDRNRSVVLATHANATSSLVDNNAPAVLGADGLVHGGTPAIPVASGIAVPPVNATVGARATVLASQGDLVDAHAHVGVAVPVLSSTPLVNTNVNLHVGGQVLSSLQPVLSSVTSGTGAGNLGGVLGSNGLVSSLPATVDGVNHTVNAVVGGITAGTPL